MLVNNAGASLFHFNQGLKKYPTLNENVAAEHTATAKGWVESQGIMYLNSRNKEEFDNSLEKFINSDANMPIVFEVFTDKENDARLQREFFEYNMDNADKAKLKLKKIIKGAIGR